MAATWTCPSCGAPFATRNASHSCVEIEVDRHFAAADPAVRAAFDRLVALASTDGDIPVVAQKTRIVLAAPMRFLAVQVRGDRLVGHLFLERHAPHPVITDVVADAYGSGLFMHRLSIRRADELDGPFAELLRESAARVGRRQRLAKRDGGRCS